MSTIVRERAGGGRRWGARRAFALPLVILLALVAALATGLLLQRQGVAYAAAQRQVELYRRHHRNMGIQELVDRWLQTLRGPLRERLGESGLAFELVLPGSETARVYLQDGQGAALDDLGAIRGPEAEYARRTLELLQLRFGRRGEPGSGPAVEALYREAGPATISAVSAPVEVLEALAEVAAPDANWRRFVNDLLQRRQETAILLQTDIRSLALGAGMNQDQTAAMEMMLTADPVIWRVEVETRSSMPPGRGRERHGGLIEISREQVGMGQATRFLTWDDLPEQ